MVNKTVFIPHLPTRQNPVDNSWVPTISLNPAAELGELMIICNHPSDAAPENIEVSGTRIEEAITGRHLIDDYILMAGDPVLCAAAIHWAWNEHGCVNILRWNRDERKYDLLYLEN